MTKTVCTCNYCKKEIVSNNDKLSGEFKFKNYMRNGEMLYEVGLDFCDRNCLDDYMKEIFPTLEWEGDI